MCVRRKSTGCGLLFARCSGELAQKRGAKRSGDDVAYAVFCSATAGMFKEAGEPEPVIEGKLFSGDDVPKSADFEAAFPLIPNCFAILVAGVVDESGRIFRSGIRRIDTKIFVDFKNVNRGRGQVAGTRFAAAIRFLGGNEFTPVNAD